MIYDCLEGINKYTGISKHLDDAIEFLEKTDLGKLPLGRTTVVEESVFVNVMESQTNEREALAFEVHHKYIDIQIDLVGVEMIEIGEGIISEVVAYDHEKDIGFYQVERSIPCVMGPGRFLICMAGEPHMPGVAMNGAESIKKCVVKVLHETGGSL